MKLYYVPWKGECDRKTVRGQITANALSHTTEDIELQEDRARERRAAYRRVLCIIQKSQAAVSPIKKPLENAQWEVLEDVRQAVTHILAEEKGEGEKQEIGTASKAFTEEQIEKIRAISEGEEIATGDIVAAKIQAEDKEMEDKASLRDRLSRERSSAYRRVLRLIEEKGSSLRALKGPYVGGKWQGLNDMYQVVKCWIEEEVGEEEKERRNNVQGESRLLGSTKTVG